MSKQNPQGQPALLFIPDISGFTQFVTETEIQHSQHIIEELLEILIEANEIGLEVSEIEGDAILFYRFGQAPTAAELLAQVQKMFVRFHAHLKRYETHRICACGACKSTHQLSLKFVAHYGDITKNNIKTHQKLFGKEVIMVHRLLKNGIDHHEYALFTENLVAACSNWVEIPLVAWTDLEHNHEIYDCGKIDYCFLALEPLMAHVPPPKLEDHSILGMKKQLFHSETVITAPIEQVFNVIADLAWRTKWIPDTLAETADINYKILQNGNTHRCLVNGPAVVTHDFKRDVNKINFTETSTNKNFCVVYSLDKITDRETRVSGDFFMKKNWFTNTFFRLFMKSKMIKLYGNAWQNLQQYCLGLQSAKKAHPYQIVTLAEENVAL